MFVPTTPGIIMMITIIIDRGILWNPLVLKQFMSKPAVAKEILLFVFFVKND